MVAQHEPKRRRSRITATDLHLTADEGVGDPRHAFDPAVLQDDRVFDPGSPYFAPVRDRGEGTDVAVDDARACADNHGATDCGAKDLGTRLHDNPSFELRHRVDGSVD